MYVIKIILPENKIYKSKKSELTPDRVLIQSIFTQLHLNQYKAGNNYKYILDFPKFKKNNIGNQINIFAKTKEELLKHIKSDKLYRLITDNCEIKIEAVNINENTKYHIIKTAKQKSGLEISKIKRLIKRGKGKISDMYKNGLNIQEISDILSRDDTNPEYTQFIKYNSKENKNTAYFYLKVEDSKIEKDDILDFNKVNSFGFANTAIPILNF